MTHRSWLRSREERFAEALEPRVADLGWSVGVVDGWSVAYRGLDRGGREFQIRAIYGETGDVLEWWGGPLRLDDLVLAVANASGSDRSWLRGVEVREGLEHAQLDPNALRDLLNAKAAEGVSPAELNEYALRMGAGGVDGVVMRFETSAVVVEPGIEGIQTLAGSPRTAAGVLTDDVRSRIAGLASRVDFRADAPTLAIFVGRPFSKIRTEVRGTSVELLQELADLGSELRERLARVDEVYG